MDVKRREHMMVRYCYRRCHRQKISIYGDRMVLGEDWDQQNYRNGEILP